MERFLTQANEVVRWCRMLARCSEESGYTTRTFLSPPMREVHTLLRDWMELFGMTVTVDAAGNLRGFYAGRDTQAPRLLIGSHLDTVPHAGAFDGVLGVVMGIALVEALGGGRFGFGIEILGFSDEEGVRFGVPYIGSRALAGTLDDALLDRRDARGVRVADAVRQFRLDPACIGEAALKGDALGYLEFHIEQGPVLESLGVPLGVVEAISGQSRMEVRFGGKAGHAGTTPMHLRQDALAGAAEWITAAERDACSTTGLLMTVGRLEIEPGAINAIPGEARASLHVRHARDDTRTDAVRRSQRLAEEIAARRGLKIEAEHYLDQPAVTMSTELTRVLEGAVEEAGFPIHRLVSGAGHDAMILAPKVPTAMLFLRSPGGISHHPDENVETSDVAAGLDTGIRFLEACEVRYA